MIVQSDTGLRIRGYTKAFDGRVVLDGLDLDVRRGEFLVVVGKSGCGKSTLLQSIAGFDPDHAGTIDRDGEVGFGFQDSRFLPWRRVWQNVVLGERGSRAARRSKAESLLAQVGLADKADAWPSTLSGGEAQRMALARALSKSPSLLLLDEPFGALDALTRVRSQALVASLWERLEFTTVLVTHDVDEAIALADRVVVINGGRIALEVPIDLPRPRRRTAPGFEEARLAILRELGVVDERGDPIPIVAAEH